MDQGPIADPNGGGDVDAAGNNRIASVSVSTYLDSASDIVTPNAVMSQLNDGTAYASDIALNGQAKNLTVAVQNTGYRKMN
jgi:hypothetical protein